MVSAKRGKHNNAPATTASGHHHTKALKFVKSIRQLKRVDEEVRCTVDAHHGAKACKIFLIKALTVLTK